MLMKLKFRGLSLGWAPSKALGGALVRVPIVIPFKKRAKVRYFSHNQLSIAELCRAVN
jgi:hypothetical protein